MNTRKNSHSNTPVATIGSNSLALTVAAAFAIGLMTVGATSAGDDQHTLVTPGEIQWSPGPASIPEGAEAAVLYGDPSGDGLFALRLRLPAGYHLPPHSHPRPEIVTVISGSFQVGMGEEAVRGDVRPLESGSFFAFDPGMAHFAYTDEETVIQLNSTGPWSIEYVNSEDDPRS